MSKNMRGFIDPLTLGFILSLIGSTAVLVANSNMGNEQGTAVAKADTTQVTVSEVINSNTSK